MRGQRVICYRDELHDDFAGNRIKTKPLRPDYCYMPRSPLWRALKFLIYRCLAQPIGFLYAKVFFAHRFMGREVLRQADGQGLYLFGNHTQAVLDAFVPNIVCWRRRGYILVGPDTMSLPGLQNLVKMLGAIPLGETMHQKKEMIDCVHTRIREKSAVTIYPEAHIWPFYTRIRPFPADSFHYPARDGAPVFTLTTCYQKRRFGFFPKAVTWVDGPFYADLSLPAEERKQALRDRCYGVMCRRAAEYSDHAYFFYQKTDEKG